MIFQVKLILTKHMSAFVPPLPRYIKRSENGTTLRTEKSLAGEAGENKFDSCSMHIN